MGNPSNNNHGRWKNIKGWFCKHRYGLIIMAIIAATFLIPLFIDWVIVGNGFPSHLTNGEWASFLGSFLGGIATMLAVVFTLRYNEKQRIREEKRREEEKKEEKRVYLDFVYHWNATIKGLRDYETDKAKNVYMFKDCDMVAEYTHCAVLQINSRSKYRIDNIKIQVETVDQKGEKHSYDSTIPFINSDELTFIVMPKPTYSLSGGRVIKELERPGSEKPEEEVKTVLMQYRTEAKEIINLEIKDQIHYSYSISGIEIMKYSYMPESRYLTPKSITTSKDGK